MQREVSLRKEVSALRSELQAKKDEVAALMAELEELREARKRKITYPKSWLKDIVGSLLEAEDDQSI